MGQRVDDVHILFTAPRGYHTMFLDHSLERKGKKPQKIHALRALYLQSQQGVKLERKICLDPLKTPYEIENQKRKLEKISRPAGAMAKSKKRKDSEGKKGVGWRHAFPSSP